MLRPLLSDFPLPLPLPLPLSAAAMPTYWPIPQAFSYSLLPNEIDEGFRMKPENARSCRRSLLSAFVVALVASCMGYFVGSRERSLHNSGLLGTILSFVCVPRRS